MSLRYVLLGLLSENSGHGYGLRKQILHRLGHFRNINEGQLYTELAKMEKEELAKKEVVVPEKGPSRKLIHITRKGRQRFMEWLQSKMYEEEGVLYDFIQGYPFFTKCTFLSHLEPEQAREKIRKQLDLTDKKKGAYSEILFKMKSRNADTYRIRILEFGLQEMDLRTRWLNELMESITDDAEVKGMECAEK